MKKAIEILRQYSEFADISIDDAEKAMFEFAEMHAQAALESAANNAYLDEKETYSPDYEKGSLYRKYFEINRESITSAYPENNII